MDLHGIATIDFKPWPSTDGDSIEMGEGVGLIEMQAWALVRMSKPQLVAYLIDQTADELFELLHKMGAAIERAADPEMETLLKAAHARLAIAGAAAAELVGKDFRPPH